MKCGQQKVGRLLARLLHGFGLDADKVNGMFEMAQGNESLVQGERRKELGKQKTIYIYL